MVNIDLGKYQNRLIDGVKNDLQAFLGSFSRWELPSPGLYTYRIQSSGDKIRIHLRIEQNGDGVLFVDVTDVIHLNPTAARMAKMALDDIPFEQARISLQRQAYNSDKTRIHEELAQIYEMIGRFRERGSGCPTCAVTSLERSPLFSKRAQAPYKADLALTYGCNNQCGHCYNEPDRFAMPSLSRQNWFQVLDKLAEVGVPHIIFTGGEATLHPDLPQLIEYADSLGMVTGLNTNGRRLAHLPFARSLADTGLNHIQVTLGSSRPAIHDAIMGAKSHDQTVKGIRNALASGLHCITNTTLMRVNMDHVEEIIEYLYDLGIRTFAMNGMIYSGGGFQDPNAIPEGELPPLLIRVRDRAREKNMRFLWYTPTEYCRMSPVELELGAKRCNAGEYSICIEPNGDVLPCQSFYISAGNILLDKWEDIWRGELFLSFRDRELDPRWAGLPEKCWQCPDFPLCGGGCRIEREAREGVRISESNNSGCSSCGTSPKNGLINLATEPILGFVPAPSTTRAENRSNGHSSHLISLDTVLTTRSGPND